FDSSQFRLETTQATVHGIQMSGADGILAPLLVRLHQRAARIDAGFADGMGDPRHAGDGYTVGNGQVAGNRRRASYHAVAADPGTAGNCYQSRDCRVRADTDVVADLDKVVDLDAVLDDGVAQRAAIDAGIGTELDIVADADGAGLRHLLPGAAIV